MTGDLYQKALTRIKRRLSYAKRPMIIHALLFTLFTFIVGGYSKLTHPGGAIDGVVYWIIVGWSLLLFAHVAFAYLHSGAWGSRREKFIAEEVLDFGDILSLPPDEMIDLHMRLSTDVRLDAQPFYRLMVNAVGNVLLWPAMLILMTIIRWTIFPTTDASMELSNLFGNSLVLSIVGTLILSFILPVQHLIARPQRSAYDTLSAIYGYKRKREQFEGTDKKTNSINPGDDELIPQTEIAKATKVTGTQ